MMIRIVSDLHLTEKFDAQKSKFLEKLILTSDQFIINGDFIDQYVTSWDKVYKSKWKRLIDLLISRKSLIIMGNHDPEELRKVKGLQIADDYLIKLGRINYYVSHGNREHPGWEKWMVVPGMRYVRGFIYDMIFLKFEDWGVRRFGKQFSKLFRYRTNDNQALKKTIGKNKNQIYIFGHTHLAEFSPDKRYINCGLVNFGHASWVEITKNGAELKQERYDK